MANDDLGGEDAVPILFTKNDDGIPDLCVLVSDALPDADRDRVGSCVKRTSGAGVAMNFEFARVHDDFPLSLVFLASLKHHFCLAWRTGGRILYFNKRSVEPTTCSCWKLHSSSTSPRLPRLRLSRAAKSSRPARKSRRTRRLSGAFHSPIARLNTSRIVCRQRKHRGPTLSALIECLHCMPRVWLKVRTVNLLRHRDTRRASRLKRAERLAQAWNLTMEGVPKPAQERVEPETQGAPKVAPRMGNG